MKTQWKIELANKGVVATTIVDDFYDIMQYAINLYGNLDLEMTKYDIDTIIRGSWLAILGSLKMRVVRVCK